MTRLAFSQAHELEPHGCTAVALTPGWIRSEVDAGALRRDRGRTGATRAAKDPHFLISETPGLRRPGGRRTGRRPEDRPAGTGSRCPAGQLAQVYGFTDLDGSRPDAWRYSSRWSGRRQARRRHRLPLTTRGPVARRVPSAGRVVRADAVAGGRAGRRVGEQGTQLRRVEHLDLGAEAEQLRCTPPPRTRRAAGSPPSPARRVRRRRRTASSYAKGASARKRSRRRPAGLTRTVTRAAQHVPQERLGLLAPVARPGRSRRPGRTSPGRRSTSRPGPPGRSASSSPTRPTRYQTPLLSTSPYGSTRRVTSRSPRRYRSSTTPSRQTARASSVSQRRWGGLAEPARHVEVEPLAGPRRGVAQARAAARRAPSARRTPPRRRTPCHRPGRAARRGRAPPPRPGSARSAGSGSRRAGGNRRPGPGRRRPARPAAESASTSR